MKKPTSLRSQIFLLMAALVCLQSVALALTLSFSGVFSMLDAEAFRFFGNTTSERAISFNEKAGSLVENMSAITTALSTEMQKEAETENADLNALYQDDESYEAFVMEGAEYLIDLLRNNSITGAFFLLNGSNADKEDPNAHSAVYIRNSAPGVVATDNSNFLLEIGPIRVSREYQIATSVKWDLDIVFDSEEHGDAYAYYENPVHASLEYPKAEIQRYGYWSPPVVILGDNQQVVCYTMPLLNANNEPYGVVGVEISLAHFTQHYLPNNNIPYQNSFFAIASIRDERILDLDWVIPSGPIAQVYLKQEEQLPLKKVAESDVYSVNVTELGEMYCSLNELTVYSKNSPFIDQNWTLVGFVPQTVLHETSSGIRFTLIVSIVSTTAIAFVAIFLLTYYSTRKIAGLSKYISSISPNAEIHFGKTGMREIDELTLAVERLNKSVKDASKTTSKILELTLLPLGGFELSSNLSYVVLTEYVYSLLDISPGTLVSKKEWEELFGRITAHPAEGYNNIYHYETEDETKSKWLRIVQTKTETGEVGIILDVTKDIEEHRRLAHELDYDALTHLYNRTAFKRESYQEIERNPDKIGAMIFADLDNLKYINDTFGHDMGDRLIMRAGDMFREFSKCGGIVSRISGDEFAIYLHGFGTKEEGRELIKRQYKSNEQYSLLTSDGNMQKIRYSSGIAWYPEDADNVTDLLKLSDYAMYEAKHNRKGTVFEFSTESYEKNAYLLENREAINKLLDEELIHFAFQPIVDLKTGEIFAYEALMRSQLPEFNSPLEILMVAGAQSKLGQLERLVVFKAFQTVSKSIREIGEKKIFINSTPSQKMSEKDLMFLNKNYAHLFDRIVIEITEAENNDPVQLNEKVTSIHEFGMKLAVDDFGSGYSTEIRILSMNPDIVKIDIALIQNIHQDEDKQKLVRNLISFCRPKGIKMIAEGVEEEADLEKLVELGMDYVQGYLTGRPAFAFTQMEEAKARMIRQLNEKYGNTE